VKLPCYQIKIDNKQFKSSRVVSTSFDFSITQILIDLLIKYQLSKLLKNVGDFMLKALLSSLE
jgi:hypothetical protein